MELAEARNVAEQSVYAAKKALDDNKDKIPAELGTVITEKIAAVENKKGSDDTAGIKAATTELATELSKVYEAVQKAAGSQPGSQQAPQDTPPAGETPPNPEQK